jgi:gas vesicle protein GvpL/GvpF
LNMAFLVARHGLCAFRERVERASRSLEGTGLDLQITGPWPPYSFCPALEMPP